MDKLMGLLLFAVLLPLVLLKLWCLVCLVAYLFTGDETYLPWTERYAS